METIETVKNQIAEQITILYRKRELADGTEKRILSNQISKLRAKLRYIKAIGKLPRKYTDRPTNGRFTIILTVPDEYKEGFEALRNRIQIESNMVRVTNSSILKYALRQTEELKHII